MRPEGGSATEASEGAVGAGGDKAGGVTPRDTAKTGVKVGRRQENMVHCQGGHYRYRRTQKHTRRIFKQEQEGRQSSCVARVEENREKVNGAQGEPTENGAIRPGHQPTQANAGTGVKGACRPQALSRYTGVRRLKPLRSCSFADSGRRERKSAFAVVATL